MSSQRDPLAALHQLIGVADYALGKAIDTAKGGWNWLFDHTIIALFLLCMCTSSPVYSRVSRLRLLRRCLLWLFSLQRQQGAGRAAATSRAEAEVARRELQPRRPGRLFDLYRPVLPTEVSSYCLTLTPACCSQARSAVVWHSAGSPSRSLRACSNRLRTCVG